VHWGYPDPSLNQGSDEDKQRAFELTRQAIAYRLLQLLQLPLGTMGKPELQAALTTIARS
jgi:arsenate reductase